MLDLGQAHEDTGQFDREWQPPRYAASVWYDWFVSALLLVATVGLLTYFLGWLLAVAIASGVLIALAITLRYALTDTVEF